MKGLFVLLILPILFTACEPRELPAPAHVQGDVLVNEAAMGENYDKQIWYSLANNQIISVNEKADWDLAFETGGDGFHVILNTSKFMDAFNTGKTSFAAVTDTAGYGQGLAYDKSDGNLDSTAIGDWRVQKPVYILNRGTLEAGAVGWVKLQILSVTETTYEISFQPINGGQEYHLTVPKDDQYSYTYVSLTGAGQVVTIAPPKDQWDLCFTQFTVQIPTPYLVTGVLLNPYKTAAAQITNIPFDSVNLSIAENIPLSQAEDTIGYDWKEYDFDAGFYTVYDNYCFIIKAQDEALYKLHFVDFYDSHGVKGNPKWEFRKL